MTNILSKKAKSKTNLVPLQKLLLKERLLPGRLLARWAVVLKLGQAGWAAEVHSQAMEFGKRQGKGQRERGHDPDRQVYSHLEGHNLGDLTQKTYSTAYGKKSRELLKKGPDHPIKIITTPYAIIKAVGGSDGSKNLKQVRSDLEQLLIPLKGEKDTYPPLLLDIKEVDGKLELTISPEYLTGRRYAYFEVPAPLPLGNEHVLLGYLQYHRLQSDKYHDLGSSSRSSLYWLMGIDTKYGKPRAERQFKQAHTLINTHLEAIGQPYEFALKQDYECIQIAKFTRRAAPAPAGFDERVAAEVASMQAAAEAEAHRQAWRELAAERPQRKTRRKSVKEAPNPAPQKQPEPDEYEEPKRRKPSQALVDHLDLEYAMQRLKW